MYKIDKVKARLSRVDVRDLWRNMTDSPPFALNPSKIIKTYVTQTAMAY